MKIHNHTLPKAIRRHSIRRWLATAITMTAMLTATLATLTGCSADNDPETATGGDGTSVTFGATIAAREGHDNGNAPASRAIPDGTFEEGDQILVHMDGKRKAFIYSTAQGFVHAPQLSRHERRPHTSRMEKRGSRKKCPCLRYHGLYLFYSGHGVRIQSQCTYSTE